MKKFLAIILAFGMLAWAGSAMATPVDFNVDGSPDSYVDLTTTDGDTISANVVTNLGDNVFTLSDNQSRTFDFFTLSELGLGSGLFDIEANLSFFTPDLDATNTGSGAWAGTVNTILGILYWEDSVQEFTLADGNIISISMQEGAAFFLPGSEITIKATVTNLGVTPVPEPSTILLLGSGLLGLVGYGRKRFSKKS